MPDLRFTWGELKSIAAAMGLRDEDPAPDAAMITGWAQAVGVIEREADHIRLFGLDEGGEEPGDSV